MRVMQRNTKKLIQIAFVLAIIVAGIRVALIWQERHSSSAPSKPSKAAPLDADYYVVPKKLHAYDAKDALELTKQPVWAREGYRYSYYAYNPAAKRVDFKQELGTLAPIEKLEVTDVVTQASPGRPGEKQIMAVFRRDGKYFAFPIGAQKGRDAQVYADEIVYIQDPHELYKHWSADTWAAIDRHEPKIGMNELQVSFALGMGTLEKSVGDTRVINYPNGGNPLRLTFRNGHVEDIQPGSGPA